MTTNSRPIGVLLLNVGTPDAPRPGPVRRYLREFLGDPRVLDIHPLGRWLLLRLIILPTRPRRSAKAYAAVWTPEGSPLLVHSRTFAMALGRALGDRYQVSIGMRYGSPSIRVALDTLCGGNIERLVLVPLFPQYASSTTGTALEEAFRWIGSRWNVPAVAVVPPFYADAGFAAAQAARAASHLEGFGPDHVLFSFHGLPVRHVLKSDESGGHCMRSSNCCENFSMGNPDCYRAQCLKTAALLATAMGLEERTWSVAFQSRLGKTPWIEPFTDATVRSLARRGVRRLAVLCPSFVADCLETLEEIGLKAADDFTAEGGEAFRLVPALNDHPRWVDAAARLIREAAGTSPDAS